ncbi:complement C5 isoform X1 [Zootoca vivipara]|uniref:complement C5 isoform X1 n=2 Tax=Zootoca vivipara TaxID=8524 RepID=UPI00293BA58E|nr:complement C5 isoform X1 [Zootoca vivipara]
MNLLGIFLFLAFCGRGLTQEQTYVVSSPKMFRVGASEMVVIQAFGYEQEFPVTISVKSFPDKQTTFASGRVQLTPANKFQGAVTLTIQPKDLSSRDPKNSVGHVYLEAISPHFTREKKMPITYENGFLFIQTDKPVYTPDQSVKVRVYSLNEELKPARRSATLTFVDPDGVEVDIIEEEDITGILSFPDFKIPPYPKYGYWTIKAKYQKDFTTSAKTGFQVKEYALPSFSVMIEPEKNFISSQQFEKFRIIIKARYFYNKRLANAQVYVRFGIIQGAEKKMLPRALQLIEMENGLAECNFNSKVAVGEIGYGSLQELDGATLYIAASVLESTGGHSEDSELFSVLYVLSPYKLNLVATPLFVKPGLPFYIKVQVKDTADSPARNIPIVFTATALNEQMEENVLVQEGAESGRRQTSQNDGTALFVVNIPSDCKVLEFRIKTADTSLPEENQASESYEAKSYASLSGSYLYIDWASNHQLLRVGDTLHINIHPSSHYLDKIHHYSYVILSKGKIIAHGTQERVKDSTYQSLGFQLTKEMVPSARLLVYYIVTGEGAAELVADSVWLNVERKCGNSLEVKLSTSERTHSPGDSVLLSLKTQFDSLVALSSMDVAIYGITRTKTRPMERALLQLEKSDLGCGAGGGQSNVDVFRRAGLTFLTNANADDSKETDEACQSVVRSSRSTIEEEIDKMVTYFKKPELQKCCRTGAELYPVMQTCTERASRIKSGGRLCIAAFKRCCEYAENLRRNETHKVLILARKALDAMLDLDPEIRSYFPESWLWEVHPVHSSKALPVTLPDSITTWEIQGVSISDKGICVADALQVQVMKNVFIDVHIPYSVVRGEQIELRGSVYNYKGSRTRYCTKVSVGEGICLLGGSSTGQQGIQETSCRRRELQGSSVALATFKILPLETGLHTINFTLKGDSVNEVLVRTLRVVPEGIRKEIHEGHTLDPQGIYGTVERQQEFRYRIPSNMVPKTKVERTLNIKGILLGEVINVAVSPEGLNLLVNLPKGSAETELMNVVPIFYAYDYLERTDSWDILGPETITPKVNLRKKLKEGLVSILSFQKKDFSYSMWENGEPSAWMTAFALRILGQVSQYVAVDKNSVCNSLTWMIDNCQMADGSFREISSYQPVKLQGTLPKEQKEKTLYLTAFSLIGFEKSIHICPLQRIEDAKNRAKDYLLQNFHSVQSTFSLAIATYALTLARSRQPGTRAAYNALKREALVKAGPPLYRYWKETLNKLDPNAPSENTARMVETTAYALLATLLQGDQNYATPIIRWLSEQQRYGGGFYSTQDTITALEALTEYSILIKRMTLFMNVKVAYKNHGDFHQYRLTKNNYVGKSVEAPLNDDLQVRTGSNTGLATVNVRSVYYKISTSEDICNFELKIAIKSPSEMNIDGRGSSSSYLDETKHLTACAKYKPSRGEPQSASSHAVMDISLISGLEANTEDLTILANNIDQLIASYEITNGHVVVQIDSIPANEFLCIGFRVAEIFRVGMASPGIFTVYEYHTPDKQCSVFYNPYGEDSLVRLCEGVECKCMEAECGRMQKRLDGSISFNSRNEVACQKDIAYVYKVNILSSKPEGSFVKYTATVLDLYKRGEAFAQKNSEVIFIKKNSCADVQLNPGENYLIMGKEALKTGEGANSKYQYPLDAMTWIEWWPTDSSCALCHDFVESMEEFVEDLFINGC